MLQAYFRSGWLFLIPYLAAYLFYAWLKWPVNPAGATSSQLSAFSSQPSVLFRPSCLLHAYWFLHGLHLVLGALALRAWWFGSSSQRSPSSFLLKAAPWFCLMLLFYIPGVYMEFPADPWEHYARTNSWGNYLDIVSNPIWTKSSYFFAYSLIGQVSPPALQLKWFDAYYTGCCLLLCWQYYRLSRAVGLGERASMVFVVTQALLFGNNLFGFYRYYGMSSSLFAQLGAVALTRIALEALQREPEAGSQPAVLRSLYSVLWRPLGAILLLLALTAFNHPQGLGIAALGIAAVVVWRLIEWRRSMIFWLALTAVILSMATIRWYPRHPVLDAFNRPQGWLTAWYGFNLFSPASPAFDRAVAIVGLGGLVNLITSLFLLRRNHVAAWLTLMPVMALCLPFVAIPFASLMAPRDELEIQLFHRMLYAIPTGLALVVLGVKITGREQAIAIPRFASPAIRSGKSARRSLGEGMFFLNYGLVLLVLCTLVLTPASSPSFNRLYNVLLRPSGDLSMHHVLVAAENTGFSSDQPGPRPVFIATPGISFVAYSTGYHIEPIPYRTISASPTTRVVGVQDSLAAAVGDRLPALFLPQPANELYTPFSQTAYLSQHWQPLEVAYEHSSGPELKWMANKLGYKKRGEGCFTCYFYVPN